MAKDRIDRDEEDLVRLYLTDIGQYALLTKDDEVRLAKAIEVGKQADFVLFDMDHFELRSAAMHHAVEEHRDHLMLEQDYVAVGGSREELRAGRPNIGSQALGGNSYPGLQFGICVQTTCGDTGRKLTGSADETIELHAADC